MNKKYKHAGDVWARVIQIIQEAMLMGVDCVDLLRQVEVVEDPEQPGTLILSPEYVTQVERMHQAWLEKAMTLQEECQVCEVADEDEGMLFKLPTNNEVN